MLIKYCVRKVIVTVLSIGLLVFTSCDPSKFQLPSHQAEIYLPILDIELDINELILADTSDILQADSTGLVSLSYNFVESRRFEEIVPLDDQRVNFTIPGIPGTIPNFDVDIPLSVLLLGITPGNYPELPPSEFNYETVVNIEEFVSADFDRGLIGLEFTNNLPFVLNAGFVIEVINNDETVPFVRFDMGADLNPGESFVFTDASLDERSLTGSFTFRINDLATPGGSDIDILASQSLDVKITYSNIKLIRGTFIQPKIELPSISFDLPFILPFGGLIKTVRLDAGNFILEVPGLDNELFLKFTMPTATQNGIPLSFELGIDKTEFELDDLEIDLSVFDSTFNLLPLELQLVFNDTLETFDIDFDRPLAGSLKLSNMDYDYLRGYLGQSNELVEEKIELAFFDRIRGGTFTFDDPRITTSISNGIGVGAKIWDDGNGLYIEGSNQRLYGTETVTIGQSLENFVVLPALSPGNPQISVIELNKLNEPDFGRFLAQWPTLINLRMPIKLGTEAIDFNQFIEGDAIMLVDVGLELPMNLAADRFIITDTTDFVVSFSNQKFEAQSASITLKYESYFPLELSFQTYFLDSSFSLIDSLFKEVRIIQPAVIGEKGVVVEPLQGEFSTTLTKEQFALYPGIVYAVPVIRLQTPDSKFVKLLSSYKLKIKMTGEVATDINLNP